MKDIKVVHQGKNIYETLTPIFDGRLPKISDDELFQYLYLIGVCVFLSTDSNVVFFPIIHDHSGIITDCILIRRTSSAGSSRYSVYSENNIGIQSIDYPELQKYNFTFMPRTDDTMILPALALADWDVFAIMNDEIQEGNADYIDNNDDVAIKVGLQSLSSSSSKFHGEVEKAVFGVKPPDTIVFEIKKSTVMPRKPTKARKPVEMKEKAKPVERTKKTTTEVALVEKKKPGRKKKVVVIEPTEVALVEKKEPGRKKKVAVIEPSETALVVDKEPVELTEVAVEKESPIKKKTHVVPVINKETCKPIVIQPPSIMVLLKKKYLPRMISPAQEAYLISLINDKVINDKVINDIPSIPSMLIRLKKKYLPRMISPAQEAYLISLCQSTN